MEVIDCEALRTAWPAQPANAWSAVALFAAGVAMLVAPRRGRDSMWVGGALGAAAIGSLVFHGELQAVTHRAHDATLLALLGVLALVAGARSRLTPLTASLVVGASVAFAAAAPAATTAASAGLVAIAFAREVPVLMTRPVVPLVIAASFLVGGALLAALGRTDGPLCSPESLLQPHAVWHALAAGGLLAYAHARGWLGYEAAKGNRA